MHLVHEIFFLVQGTTNLGKYEYLSLSIIQPWDLIFTMFFLIEASWYLDDWTESVFQSMRSENYFSEPRKSFYFYFLNKIFKF